MWLRRMGAAVLLVALIGGVGLILSVTYTELTKDTSGTEIAAGPADVSETDSDSPATTAADGDSTGTTAEDASAPEDPTTTTTTTLPYDGWVDPASSGQPYGTTVEGLLTFRGNPTRSYYGQGPVPTNPSIQWSFPREGGMCSQSSSGGVTKTWCGTGWTGQPAVWDRDGEMWMSFGAYDRNVHFLDPATGERRIADFPTGDIIKGTVTVDPDGFPLVYSGSRDGFFHIIATDREGPEELYRLSATAVSGTKWNDDWDGSALVLDDYLFEGGENSVFHILKLNRGYDANGFVTVDPELVFNAPGYDDELINIVGNNVSIENSVAISGDTVYFANSGGLVQGWDISGLKEGIDPTRVFRFWTGDDTDATIVIDEEGFLYVGSEYERGTQRSKEVGQIMKLDPTKPDDPLVWSVDDSDRIDGGIWATAGIYKDILIVPTNGGRLMGIDRETGEVRWTHLLTGPLWQSPVIVDDVLIQGDCNGVLHGLDVSNTSISPPELWRVDIGGCIESTPAVWDGWIYVGTRNGQMHAIADS
jgi:PQQ-like domain